MPKSRELHKLGMVGHHVHRPLYPVCPNGLNGMSLIKHSSSLSELFSGLNDISVLLEVSIISNI